MCVVTVIPSGLSRSARLIDLMAKLGHYNDTLVREAGRWRFLRREAPADIG